MFFAGKSPKEDYKSTDYKYHLNKTLILQPAMKLKMNRLCNLQ